MALIDIVTLCVLPIGALIFLVLALYLRGQFWWALLSGLLWILFGYTSIANPEIFHYQRLLGSVWIVIGISVLWMPAYYKKKGQQKTLQEMAAEADGEVISDEDRIDDYNRKQRAKGWRKTRGINNDQED